MSYWVQHHYIHLVCRDENQTADLSITSYLSYPLDQGNFASIDIIVIVVLCSRSDVYLSLLLFTSNRPLRLSTIEYQKMKFESRRGIDSSSSNNSKKSSSSNYSNSSSSSSTYSNYSNYFDRIVQVYTRITRLIRVYLSNSSISSRILDLFE